MQTQTHRMGLNPFSLSMLIWRQVWTDLNYRSHRLNTSCTEVYLHWPKAKAKIFFDIWRCSMWMANLISTELSGSDIGFASVQYENTLKWHFSEAKRGGGHAWQGACVAGGCVHGRGACMAGEMATAADGAHPTGMHSCLWYFPLLCLNRQLNLMRNRLKVTSPWFLLSVNGPLQRDTTKRNRNITEEDQYEMVRR